MLEYWRLLVFVGVCAALGGVLIILPLIVNKLRPDKEKNSPYECGVESDGENKQNFNVHFYLIAMLFIVFDLEIAMLLPWALINKSAGMMAFYAMLSFATIVTGSLIYEWKKGAMD
jgi:NADH-quinone oxidoreductase subunit A